MMQLQGSWEADHTEMTPDWSLVVKGWNCRRGTDLLSVQGSDLRMDCKSDNTVRVI